MAKPFDALDSSHIGESPLARAWPLTHKQWMVVRLLAEADANDRPYQSVFELSDIKPSTWYGNSHHPGWKDNPVIQDALQWATKQARSIKARQENG